MAKKILTVIKLQIPGGQANPAPPVGPALGQHGVNIMEFCKAFNAQTQEAGGRITPVEITVFEDRSFTFITKTPPAAVLIKGGARPRQGLGRAESQQGGDALARAGPPDRRDEARRPERPRRRPGHANRGGDGALYGSGGSKGMTQHGKRYRQGRGTIDRESVYSPLEAVRLVKELPDAKFDETVELHFNLGLNVRHAEQQLRGTLMLPHGTGKEMTVAVFAEGEKAKEAQDAGADVVGAADLAAKIEGGFDEFDVAVATPDMMGTVGKLGRILGPRGKMPNPKAGTVTFDVGKAVRDAKAGKLEYRTDRGANVHLLIGKKSFSERQLLENYATILEEIVRAKPSAAKGRYIRTITLTTSMGPGVRIDPAKTRGIVEELEEAVAAA